MENAKTSGRRGNFELIVQLITAASILFGIYLVMVELRQAREISTTAMVHNRVLAMIEHDSNIYGENLAETLAKACHNPIDLSDAEVIALNRYFQNRMTQTMVVYTAATLGTFQRGIGLVEDWKQLSAPQILEVLSYSSGRKWMKTHVYWNNQNPPPMVKDMVEFVQSFNFKSPWNCADMRGRVTPSI